MKKVLKITAVILLLCLVIFSPIIRTDKKVYEDSDDFLGYKNGNSEFSSTLHDSFDYKFADKPGTLNEIELLSSSAEEISSRPRKSLFRTVLFDVIIGEKTYAFGDFEIIRYDGLFKKNHFKDQNFIFINRDYKMPEPAAEDVAKISVCKTYKYAATLDEQINFAEEDPLYVIKKWEENTPSILDISSREMIERFISDLMLKGNINSFYDGIKNQPEIRDFLSKSKLKDEEALYFKVYFKDTTIPFCIGIYPY